MGMGALAVVELGGTALGVSIAGFCSKRTGMSSRRWRGAHRSLRGGQAA
jgi:hypothetical protein